MKTKKLGLLHILTTYIWLPLVIIGYAYDIIKLFVYVFANIHHNFSIDAVVHFMLVFGVLMLAAFAFVSLIQQNIMAVLLLRFTLLLYVGDYLFRGILSIEQDNVIWLSLPITLIIPITISVLLYRYYGKRIHLFTNKRMGTIITNSEAIIETYIGGCVSILLLIIEGYSIYRMFQNSVGEGLFGVFVPVIAQLVYLVKTGFATGYANTIYGLLIIAASIYGLVIIKEHTTTQLLQTSSQPKKDEIFATDDGTAKETSENTQKIAELQIEFSEISALSYRMKQTLETARNKFGNMTVHDINVLFENKTITDTEARDLITHLTDARKIIEQYPDMIEKIDRRCAELNEQIKFLKGEIRY